MDVSGALAKSWDRDQGASFRLRLSRLLPHPQREATTRLVQEGELRLSVRKTLTVTQLQRAGPGLGAQAICLPPLRLSLGRYRPADPTGTGRG